MEPLIRVRPFHQPHPLLPTDPRATEFLRGPGPVDLEIGCGVGWHPVSYALENPARRLVAIEHTREKFAKFLRRYDNHGAPEHLLPVHANAISWVHQFAPPQIFDRVFLLYPNPEAQNSSKRWLRMPFFGRLLESVKPGGEIRLATNIEAYAQEAAHYAVAAWGLEVIEFRSFRAQDARAGELRPRTHFEAKYLLRGETCFDLRIGRKGSST